MSGRRSNRLRPKETSRPVIETKHKVFLGTYVLALLGLGSVYYLLRLRLFGFAARYVPLIQRLTLGAMAIVLVLAAAEVVDVYLINRIEDDVSRYNIKRILRLITGLILAFIVVSILFANWYAAVVSLGLISLILGFALQTPITSFIGWIYLLVRAPYRVGDRIRTYRREAAIRGNKPRSSHRKSSQRLLVLSCYIR